jgi:acyl-CoA reductase-like NAD-dependent aldehyde dehydrogenase
VIDSDEMTMLMIGSGGNDAAVVFPDVDIDKVAEKVSPRYQSEMTSAC